MAKTMLEKVNYILQEKNEKIIPENIKKGIKILGVEGDYSPIVINRSNTIYLGEWEYTVENKSTSYGFYKNEEGYYQSNNKGDSAKSSYAKCRINFSFNKRSDLIIDCINFAEKGYDYGIISNVDKELSNASSADSSTTTVFHSFKSENSSSVVRLTIPDIPSGDHFIEIKFIKDSSGNQNNDDFRFKVIGIQEVDIGLVVNSLTDLNEYDVNKYGGSYAFVLNEKALYQLIDGSWSPVNLSIPPSYVNTSDADATPNDIVKGKTAYVNGEKITGINSFSKVINFQGIKGGELTYKVENISTDYGFFLNDNNFYESSNKGNTCNNTYSKCRLYINKKEAGDVILECINFAESSYDYGIIGNIDKELTNSHNADSSNVLFTFKSKQSSNIVEVTIPNVPSGEHFVEIKYIKDSSQSDNYDSLQFRIKGDVVNNTGIIVSTLSELDSYDLESGTHAFVVDELKTYVLRDGNWNIIE